MGGRQDVLLAPIGRAHLPHTTQRAGRWEAVRGDIPEQQGHSAKEKWLAAEPTVPHQVSGPLFLFWSSLFLVHVVGRSLPAASQLLRCWGHVIRQSVVVVRGSGWRATPHRRPKPSLPCCPTSPPCGTDLIPLLTITLVHTWYERIHFMRQGQRPGINQVSLIWMNH